MPANPGALLLTQLLARRDADVLLGQVQQAMESAVDSTVDSLYPDEEYMITIPFIFGLITALLTAASLALGYLPSVTATYIQLRTGVIPTLTDKLLHRYRAAVSCPNEGATKWACTSSLVLTPALSIA